MDLAASPRATVARAAALRGLALFALWLVIGGRFGAGDLAMGVVAAALACWVSLRLLPPGQGPAPRPAAIARLTVALPAEALRAGWDVARRALDPRLPLRPGIVTHQLALPPGPARDGFLAVASLLPGTLPAGPADGQGSVPIHALDTAQPVAAAMTRDEARFAQASGHG